MGRKKDSLSAFDNALNKLGYGGEVADPVTNADEDFVETYDANDDIDDFEEELTPANDGGEDEVSVEDSQNNDNTPIPDNVLNDSIQQDDIEPEPAEQDDELSDADQLETQNVRLFFDAFAEELGWDVNDDEKPDSMEGLVNYIEDTVRENSVPQYADERIAQLDQYVKNGGKFEDFYNNMSQTMEYDNLNLEDESNQKMAVRDYLKLTGYSDEQINKKIERYEDADVLEDEAADALERLKEHRQYELQVQQEQQERARMENERQAVAFVNNLGTTINSLDSIRGVQIPKQDRKALFDYITRVDSDGLTQY